MLGTPTEIYVHGTSYLFICCTVFFVTLATSFVYLPVFHELKLTSTYEYLEKRFDKRIRLLGSILFAISIVSKVRKSYLYKSSHKHASQLISIHDVFLDNLASNCHLRTCIGLQSRYIFSK